MKTLISSLILGIVSVMFFACDDMNSIHEEYLNRGEEIYTGVIDSLNAYPGNERVKFTWEINADPRITKTVIFWSDGADSAVVEVNRTQPGIMKMETILNLPEKSYIFKFVTKDDEGHKSLSVENTVEVYGPNYVSTLRNREIRTITAQEDSSVLLTLGALEDVALLYTMIAYTDYSDPSNPKKVEEKIENSASSLLLSNIRAGDEIFVYSVYQPESSLDIFEANATVYHVPALD